MEASLLLLHRLRLGLHWIAGELLLEGCLPISCWIWIHELALLLLGLLLWLLAWERVVLLGTAGATALAPQKGVRSREHDAENKDDVQRKCEIVLVDSVSQRCRAHVDVEIGFRAWLGCSDEALATNRMSEAGFSGHNILVRY